MFHNSLSHFIQVSAPISPRQLTLTSLPKMATLNFDPSLEPLICFPFPSEHLAQPKVIVHAYSLLSITPLDGKHEGSDFSLVSTVFSAPKTDPGT